MCYNIINREEVNKVAKQKKKRKSTKAKEKIDYKVILLTAIADLVVGTILIIIDKIID